MNVNILTSSPSGLGNCLTESSSGGTAYCLFSPTNHGQMDIFSQSNARPIHITLIVLKEYQKKTWYALFQVLYGRHYSKFLLSADQLSIVRRELGDGGKLGEYTKVSCDQLHSLLYSALFSAHRGHRTSVLTRLDGRAVMFSFTPVSPN